MPIACPSYRLVDLVVRAGWARNIPAAAKIIREGQIHAWGIVTFAAFVGQKPPLLREYAGDYRDSEYVWVDVAELWEGWQFVRSSDRSVLTCTHSWRRWKQAKRVSDIISGRETLSFRDILALWWNTDPAEWREVDVKFERARRVEDV